MLMRIQTRIRINMMLILMLILPQVTHMLENPILFTSNNSLPVYKVFLFLISVKDVIDLSFL